MGEQGQLDAWNEQASLGLEVTGQGFLENAPTFTFNSVSLHIEGMVLGPLALKFPVYAVVRCETFWPSSLTGGLSAHDEASSCLVETATLLSPTGLRDTASPAGTVLSQCLCTGHLWAGTLKCLKWGIYEAAKVTRSMG